MKDKKQYFGMKSACRLWVVVLLLSACADDGESDFDGCASSLRLNLSLAMPREITVEPQNTRAAGDVTDVTDVRVFQFATDGSLKKDHKYASTDIKTDATGLPAVETKETDFDDVNSRFYIVINTADKLDDLFGSSAASTSDESALSARVYATEDIFSTQQAMVYGPYTYTGSGSTVKKTLQLLAKMRHIGARVDVSWSIPDDVNLTITSAQVENVPKNYYLYEQTPVPAVSEYLDPQSVNLTTSPNSFTFYMPENLKGSGKSVTPQGKNMVDNGPSGTLDGCTCIVLKGEYRYGTADDTNGVAVEYRFYLGADMINNYDVERGKVYQLAITLSGANSADARVSITDSNVFGIDNIDGTDDVNHDIKF